MQYEEIIVVFFSTFLVWHTVLAGKPPGNKWYTGNRAPLLPGRFVRLPATALTPGGWLRRQLENTAGRAHGKSGQYEHLATKKGQCLVEQGRYREDRMGGAALLVKGVFEYRLLLRDEKMIRETKFWIDAVLNNQRANGDFGPDRVNKGNRDLWTNMPMVWCLQSYYEYSGDKRVLGFLRRYFTFQLSIPDEQFLKDYWENSRGGDDMYSVYWLYNRTGNAFLLELANRIDGDRPTGGRRVICPIGIT